MNDFSVIALSVAAILGIVIAIRGSNKKKVDWAELQMAVDVFTAAKAKDWFAEKGSKQLLVAYLTQSMVKELDIHVEKIDAAHYLVLAALDEKNQVKTYQLVNFDRLENSLKELLDSNGGKIVIAY